MEKLVIYVFNRRIIQGKENLLPQLNTWIQASKKYHDVVKSRGRLSFTSSDVTSSGNVSLASRRVTSISKLSQVVSAAAPGPLVKVGTQ